MAIVSGNAKQESTTTRGWFVGAFIESQGLQRREDIEVKWGEHPAGETRESKASEGEATTLSILIRGKFSIQFAGQEEIMLEEEGDYAMWNPNIPHTSTCHEDSLVITVRWPSLSAKKN